jgi:DNA repair protein RadC
MEKKPVKYISIKNWSEEDRPREKLLRKGKRSLTKAELIAILLGSGSRNESAVSLSKRILSDENDRLKKVAKKSVQELMRYNGVGEAKAISITAALELANRMQEEAVLELDKVNSSQSVYTIMKPLIGDLPHEEFYLICLNNSNKITHKHPLSRGGITGTVVDIRIALKMALEHNAVSLIMVHNHPSGKIHPSQPDKQLTQKLKQAAEHLDIKVLDHVIVTENAYFSFADEGLI